jgi:large subunit ribosomal protein L25
MAAPNTLTASTRAGRGTGPARQTRRAGGVPAVVYGLGADNEAVTVDAHDLELILHGPSGVNTVITLKVDGGKDQLALCRQIQRHPVKHSLVHVDFIRVRADVAVQADVPLELVGEPEGVRNGGLLDQLHFTISVSARPADIPTSIQYDVSALDIGGQVHVRDLEVPRGVVLVTDADELIAAVSVSRAAAAEEAAEGAEGEGEGAEGEGEGAAEGGDSGEATES